jgi:glycosyltransferase involved in cell wall biosynthesis
MKTTYNFKNQTVILSLCRLVAKKRVDIAIKAFANWVHTTLAQDAVMVIGGSGPEEQALRSLCRELSIEAQVVFLGYVPESQLRDWYCSCDVLISADNADYDLSVMMALPLGCKVVVSTQYGIPDCLDRMRRYFFVAEPSLEGFSKALHEAACASVESLTTDDLRELDVLSWENYSETVLNLLKHD